MKSVKQQYIDLKEGKITQQNFMRDLRRDMPYLVTNVTSFGDAVRILKNKGILNESFPREEHNELMDFLLKYVKDPDEAQQYFSQNPNTWPDWLISNLSRDEGYQEYLMDQNKKQWDSEGSDPNDPEFSFKGDNFYDRDERDFEDEGDDREDLGWDNDDENLIDRYPGDDYNDGEFWEGKDPEEDDDFYPDNDMFENKLNEIKNRITAAQTHPQELAMGRKVEMEHTDNVETAERIALDHLTEDPFYYTKLHVAGLADELNKDRPKVKKSTKKRTDIPTEVGKDNTIDKGNQMTVVKDVPKIKANANKAKKETNKGIGKITLMSLVAQSVRGVQKMNATGEKMKKVKIKEGIDDIMDDNFKYINKEPKNTVNKFKEILKTASKEQINKFVKEYSQNPDKYNLSKDEMKDIILFLKKKDKLKEDQSNIQNRADEINEFAKLVKSKDYNSIIEQYESIIEYPSEWNITAKEAMTILQKYFNDEDWDKFEEITSDGYNSDADSFENDMDAMSEASLNMLPNEKPNDIVIKAQEYIDSNPILKQLSDRIDLQNVRQEAAILKFDYWKPLPQDAVSKLELQFNVEVESDDDDDTGPITAYRLTPKSKENVGMGLNTLNELIRKELKEYFDGRDNLTDIDSDDNQNSDGNIMENLKHKFIKILQKLGWAGESWTPQEIRSQIKNLPDNVLLIWNKNKVAVPGTPLELQNKLVDTEIKLRGLDQNNV